VTGFPDSLVITGNRTASARAAFQPAERNAKRAIRCH
jgi:hypothetical protein